MDLCKIHSSDTYLTVKLKWRTNTNDDNDKDEENNKQNNNCCASKICPEDCKDNDHSQTKSGVISESMGSCLDISPTIMQKQVDKITPRAMQIK